MPSFPVLKRGPHLKSAHGQVALFNWAERKVRKWRAATSSSRLADRFGRLIIGGRFSPSNARATRPVHSWNSIGRRQKKARRINLVLPRTWRRGGKGGARNVNGQGRRRDALVDGPRGYRGGLCEFDTANVSFRPLPSLAATYQSSCTGGKSENKVAVQRASQLREGRDAAESRGRRDGKVCLGSRWFTHPPFWPRHGTSKHTIGTELFGHVI